MNNQFDGDFTEHKKQDNVSTRKPVKKNNPLLKMFLVSLVGGVIGGGAVFGGYAVYQNNNTNQVTTNNSEGATTTSKIKVTESNQATKAFNKIKDAVVSVEAYSKKSTSVFDSLYGSDDSDQDSATSEGSGVIYKKTDNTAFVVTNNHVISGANKFEILMSNGKKVKATLVGHDSISDLAVLKINAKYVSTVASFGNSDDISVGQTALAIGSPLGSQYATSLTEGIISAKKRTVDVTNSAGVTTDTQTVIQTDTAINPGNSGGPLVNLAGQVIGINSMKLSSTGSSSSESTSVEGMGFAIPSNEVVSIINQLVSKGKVSRPSLGISLIDLAYVSESAQKDTLKLPSDINSGIVVMKISSDSPLKNSGISKYDVITKLGGKDVTNTATLRSALYEHKVGDKVSVEYYHNGQKKTTTVTLDLEANDTNTTTSSDSGE